MSKAIIIRRTVLALALLSMPVAGHAKGSCKDAEHSSQTYCQPDSKEVKNFRSGTVGQFVAMADDKVVVRVEKSIRSWSAKNTSKAN